MSEARQIQSMIDFIEREAQERAEELDAAAQEEYDVEKMRLVEVEKVKVRATTEQKKKQVDIDRRVARANFSKTQRLRVMEERSRIMDELRENTRRKIAAFVKDTSRYQKLLLDLIHQALLAVRTDAVIQSRKEDEAAVQGMINDAEQWYRKTVGSKITVTPSKEYLNTEEAWGGVIVTSHDGHIICNLTLSCRMRNCFEDQLPAIRYYLFNSDASV
ncbi:ATP synthase, putative [Trypanosoma cruzi]|uniref:Putative ATP synthase n=1 Tax=Trypanosoma cruzi TaxID=5693 RepID=A0A2V2V995_TRYCR|nr:ATP synthase, putative [Trypanosoma cruzi]KAF8286703.1 putative ATP synthase [Trypanosoma cruzi]PBJ69390.1 ATP synthase [Trypanosoma cruzi cruzi]PWU92162.1 putative ATP synthase [Trypanosoma cruzi]RNF16562.1 putative ATP synthase [Trypanosoma cruzi]